ncbi:MAG: hypothetical protein ABI488_13290 [Polyangiaceae bacterium]
MRNSVARLVATGLIMGGLCACKGHPVGESALPPSALASAGNKLAPLGTAPSASPALTSDGSTPTDAGAAPPIAPAPAVRVRKYGASPPVALAPQVVKQRQAKCSVDIQSIQVSTGIDANALAHVNELLRVQASWAACVPGEDTKVTTTVHANSAGILSVEIAGGRLDRNPPESAMGGAGESYGVSLNFAVPAGDELQLSDLLTDTAPEPFAKVIRPELLKALSQPGFAPASERENYVEICIQFFSPDLVTFQLDRTGMLVSAPSLPHAFQGLPPLKILFTALADAHLIRADGPLPPLLAAH